MLNFLANNVLITACKENIPCWEGSSCVDVVGVEHTVNNELINKRKNVKS